MRHFVLAERAHRNRRAGTPAAARTGRVFGNFFLGSGHEVSLLPRGPASSMPLTGPGQVNRKTMGAAGWRRQERLLCQ